LDNFIAESEENCMSRLHPFFQINEGSILVFVGVLQILFFFDFQVVLEVLQQRDFLLELLGIVGEGVLADVVLAVAVLAFHVLEVEILGVGHDLGGVVEEDAGGAVGQQVAEPVLAGVVDPLFDEDFVLDLGGLFFVLAAGAAHLEVVERLGRRAREFLLRIRGLPELVLVRV